jgi:hypothetical protein
MTRMGRRECSFASVYPQKNFFTPNRHQFGLAGVFGASPTSVWAPPKKRGQPDVSLGSLKKTRPARRQFGLPPKNKASLTSVWAQEIFFEAARHQFVSKKFFWRQTDVSLLSKKIFGAKLMLV